MIDLVQYILQEVQTGRLPKDLALEMLRKHRAPGSEASSTSAASSSKNGSTASGIKTEDRLLTLVPMWEAVTDLGKFEPGVGSKPISVIGAIPDSFMAFLESSQDTNRLQRNGSHTRRVVSYIDAMPADSMEVIAEKVKAAGPLQHLIWVAPKSAAESATDERILVEQSSGILLLFRVIKAVLSLGYGSRDLDWTVIIPNSLPVGDGSQVDPTHAGVHGLVGSVTKEHAGWKSRCLDLLPWDNLELNLLPPLETDGASWAFREKQWQFQKLLKLKSSAPTEAGGAVMRQGGVYVVIGGAGGIGGVWTEHAVRNHAAQVVWIGRRPLNAEIESRINRFKSVGPCPVYFSADATDRRAMERVLGQIKTRFGNVRGIVHSAIVLADQTVAKMDEERFYSSFHAKAGVSVRLAQVFKDEPLDFVLFFSTLMSFNRPPGQANYVAGSFFNDVYARRLSHDLGCMVKVMNWGYWGKTGIVASESYQARMAEAGLGSIEPGEGIAAINALLSGPANQLGLIKIKRDSVMEQMGLAGEIVQLNPKTFPSAADGLAKKFKVSEAEIDSIRAHRQGLRVGELDQKLARLLSVQLGPVGRDTSGAASAEFPGIEGGAHGVTRPTWGRWLQESRSMILAAVGDLPLDAESEWKNWEIEKQFWLNDSNTRAQIVLAETGLKALPEILAGKRKATDVLFPGGSLDLLQGIYKNNLVSDFFNTVLAEALKSFLDERLRIDPSARFRILEIGAGTGGTTGKVLSTIQPLAGRIEEYCYSDLSQVFMAHGQKNFANPFLTCRILDINKPLEEQGIDLGGFDAVIATNILHATPNIRVALRNAKAALRTNGLLFINEFIQKTVFTHVTFGLLDGWWLYEDEALRMPGCPGLGMESWAAVLKSEGFSSLFTPAKDAADFGQQILIAESDGIIRQKVAARPVQTSAAPQRGKSVAPVSSRPELHDMEVPLEDQVRTLLVSQLQVSLKVKEEAIGLDVSFADYGVDSITGVRLIQGLNETLGIELSTTDLFDHSTIKRLAAHICKRHEEKALRFFQGKGASPKHDAPIPQTNGVQRVAEMEGDKANEAAPTSTAISSSASVSIQQVRKEPVAIIGMSGRFAQSPDLETLWTHLAAGRTLVGEATRWDLRKILHETLGSDKPHCVAGSFLDGINEFDPMFFNISGTEATYMDPQHRLFLEESWKALEEAGYTGKSVEGKSCGVYVGYNNGDYKELFGGDLPPQAMWGNAGSVIPARIAYHLNLHGPAVAVDTACSSSLVAIHLACQGLWTGEMEMALAGGVFVQSTPMFYQAANRAGMLSPSGRCNTFDQGADGFVPGEGVGVVVLKRLADALRDGDHIHGVIRGSGINQDGATNGVTAPSAESQERLETQVYQSCNLHPDGIQMVEAHGTGTKLGDPIEFEALSRTFRKWTSQKSFCAIGSIKTNLGHTTAAAGIAGLFKILLALRHRQIPPSLNFQSGNPAIKFADSPFYVNRTLSPWQAPQGGSRIAVVSAFGFSGTNAHMVIEEAPVSMPRSHKKPGFLITLSARSKDQLQIILRRLVERLDEAPQIDLGDLSHTLLLGRRHLEYRWAGVVQNMEQLRALLSAGLTDDAGGKVFYSKTGIQRVMEQPALKRQGLQLLEVCRKNLDSAEFLQALSNLAELHVLGYEFNFEPLFEGEKYGRIPLPLYPFARDRFWVPAKKLSPTNVPDHKTGQTLLTDTLHPLLHRNISGLPVAEFVSRFSGREFFLADHVIQGRSVLPAAACLEIARAALMQIEPGMDPALIRLRNVGWYQPFHGDVSDSEMHVTLTGGTSGSFDFEIHGTGLKGHRQVFCQGNIGKANPQSDRLDMEELRRESRRIVDGAECYRAFNEGGLCYGPAHQSLEKLEIGRGNVLASLRLPESVKVSSSLFGLHPSLIDGALQSIVGLGWESGSSMASSRGKVLVPFALESLEILRPCGDELLAFTRSREAVSSGRVDLVDIDLCDFSGEICVRIRGLATRVIQAGTAEATSAKTLLFVPEIKEKKVPSEAQSGLQMDRVILFSDQGHLALMKSFPPGTAVIDCSSDETSMVLGFEETTGRVFDAIQKILGNKEAREVLVQLVIRDEAEDSVVAALGALLKTASIENPRLHGQLIRFSADDDLRGWIEERPHVVSDTEVIYRQGKRFVAGWKEWTAAAAHAQRLPLKNGGVYLMTGGAGGIGREMVRSILATGSEVVLILAGRSRLSESQLKDLFGSLHGKTRVVYRQVNLANASGVNELVFGVVGEFGRIDGIFHAAGVLRDSFILNKSKSDISEVFAPKVAGLVHLDLATAGMPLDFFVCFSAVAGVIGNAGQADYAVANAFMDRYAEYRNRLMSEGRRFGRTVSVNWPLWKDGGMKVGSVVQERMRALLGMIPLETGPAMSAMAAAMASGQSRVLVLAGEVEKIRAFMKPPNTAFDESKTETAARVEMEIPIQMNSGDPGRLAATISHLTRLVADVVQLPEHRIDPQAPTEKFGIDSLMVMKLTEKLEKDFGSLSKTLFFEYQTIAELAGYFAKHHSEKVAFLTGKIPPASGGPETTKALGSVEKPGKSATQPETVEDRIAIIGLAGRYPQADSIEAFWDNLRNGVDCITEIPKDRWDHSKFYDADRTVRGKTYAKWGGFLNGVDQFDPGLFGISPREAAMIDPQERLFLECVYETLEDAGYSRDHIGGPDGDREIGVFVGVMYEEYQLYGAQETERGRPLALPGNPSSIANRVSYFFNFHGPSMAVDTMCSSSLTSIHLACQSLRSGDCRLAVAGGVNVSVHPNKYLMLAQGNFAAGNGRCESFGAGGDGYVPSEGVGAVLLKPLKQAIADGDHIYGLIRASAVNHGGKTNGYTVPNPNQQARLISRALERAQIHPESIGYIEAHGTGTTLGDPIEIAGLSKAFGLKTDRKQFCPIGSVKSNIGHCESAAGIAGVTKVLLQLRHGLLVPSIHSDVLNPNIDFAQTPFVVQRQLAPWKKPAVELDGETIPRVAGISSFGAGGSYAHVMIEEWEGAGHGKKDSGNPQLILFSAKTGAQLLALLQKWESFLAENSDGTGFPSLESIAWTLQSGRIAMEERLAFEVRSLDELKKKIGEFLRNGDSHEGVWRGRTEPGSGRTGMLDEDDFKTAVEGWLMKRKLSKLAGVWVKGTDIDWTRQYHGLTPLRCSLPTTPFNHQRCWYNENPGNTPSFSTSKPDATIVHSLRTTSVEGSTKLPMQKPAGITLKSLAATPAPPVKTSPPVEPVRSIAVPATTEGLVVAQSAISPSPNGQDPVPGMNIEELQKQLIQSLAAALFMKSSEIDPDKSFVDLGLDSIIGVEWIRALNRDYGTTITATKVYDHPSLRKFAAYLAGEMSKLPKPVSAASVALSAGEPQTEVVQKPVSIPVETVRSQAAFSTERTKDYGLVLDTVRSLEEISLKSWPVPDPGPGEIQIRVEASAINFPDTMCVKGLYPTMPDYPFVPGFEVAGVVTKTGPQAIGFEPGDEVIALTGKQMGGHARFVNVPASGVVAKPSNISFEEAASLPVVFGTVFHAFTVGNLSPGEQVLIQTATGGCGLVALQLANLIGCVTYGTSSRTGKLDLLRRLGVEKAFNYKTGAFDSEVLECTGGRGVDIVLNMLSGDGIQKGLNCLAPSGRYLELAVHGLKTSPKLDLSRLLQNQSIHSIDLRQLSLQGGFDGKRAMEKMVSMISSGTIVPIVSRIYPVSQIAEAFEYVSTGSHIGKVVISHSAGAMVDCSEKCIEALIRHREKCRAGTLSLRLASQNLISVQKAVVEDSMAIIGMSGQFPKSPDLQTFWENILNGVNCVSEIPGNRWSIDQFYQPGAKSAGKSYSKWMGALEGVDQFDPLFFNISHAEAEWMDPQQRLFLQNCWHCIEDAGVSASTLSGSRCGVYVGCGAGDYAQGGGSERLNPFALMGGASSMLASRISYFLNLKGPSLAIDTACSSSLVAIAEACQNLMSGSVDLALAGGVYVMSGPSMHIMTSQAGMLSTDGKCHAFDSRANGFVPGEGVGVLLLKRLSDAIRDQDPIQGIIRGWGVNQDGKTNGITAPSASSQIGLEKSVYQRFNINPETITLMEAHGTGTQLGDPIEAEALVETFRHFTGKQNFCALGSVKTNIGHLMPAAGVAGVVKILLALRQETLPPTIHFQELNQHVPLLCSPFYINTEAKPWKSDTSPRRAAVSSFGFSGTNAHLVIEEYLAPATARTDVPRTGEKTFLFLLSAKNESRLKAYARLWLSYLESWSEDAATQGRLHAAARTLQLGREPMEQRLALVAGGFQELRKSLSRFLGGESGPGMFEGCVKKEAAPFLLETEEGKKLVSDFWKNNKLENLARLWVQGETIDWKQLHSIRTRIPGLPTYPFSEERFWKSFSGDTTGPALQTSTARPQPAQSPEISEPLVFEETWVEENAVSGPAETISTIICFLSDATLQLRFFNALREFHPGIEIIFVSENEGDHSDLFKVLTVDRARPGSYGELFDKLSHIKGSELALLYLWPVEDARQSRDFESIFHLVQGLGSLKPRRLILSADVQDSLDRCYVESWIGFERSLPKILRHTEVSVVLNHEAVSSHSRDMEVWAARLWSELQQARCCSVIFENGRRLVSIARPAKMSAGKPVLRSKATYLITGGCGGLGALFATHLASRYSANLVLLGRSSMSSRIESQLKNLRSLGSKVLYFQADVSDEKKMGSVIEETHRILGPVHGVFHLAGGGNGESILKKSWGAFQSILEPKIEGTLVLDKVTQGEPLDFVCYFSSSSAVLGDAGSCDYATGNRFLMAYARRRNQLHTAGLCPGKTVVINWPLWRSGGMGFGQEPGLSEAYLKSTDQRFLEGDEGLALFEKLLGQERIQHLVMVGNQNRIHQFLRIETEPRSLPAATVELPDQVQPRPVLKTNVSASPGIDLKAVLIEELKHQIHAQLKVPMEQLDIRTNFADFGFDSISLEEWSRKLSLMLDDEITPTTCFANPTIEKLANQLLAGSPEKIRSAFGRTESATDQVVWDVPPQANSEKGGYESSDPLSLPARNERAEGRGKAPKIEARGGAADSHQPVSSSKLIAVIGMSGRFPQADNIHEFWKKILESVSAITEIPSDRWDWRDFYSATPSAENRSNSKWGGFLTDVDRFDPLFFGIAPSDAVAMDPRQRLFLEEAWKTFEDAGYMGARVRGSNCGVFVGVEEGEYGFLASDGAQINGNQNATLAARIAYALDLKGPNFALNSACSSGLVALHQACLALRNGDCEMALVGGINLLLSPLPYLGMKQAGMLASDGVCRVFEEGSQGMVPGEAVVAVLLKPLDQAIKDGDNIHGCIRASGVNYDGRTNGITTPNPDSQASLIDSVHRSQKISPEEIGLVLAHSVGSRLGDPIEIEAYSKAFSHRTTARQFCQLRSIKPLIGHTFAASGLVNLVAMIMAMKEKVIPGMKAFKSENRYLHLDRSPFRVESSNVSWASQDATLRTGSILATGISGTNALVVVQEYRAATKTKFVGAGKKWIVPLSARTLNSLVQYAKSLISFLSVKPGVALEHLAFTLQNGREPLAQRAALVTDSIQHLERLLQALVYGDGVPGLYRSQGRSVEPGTNGETGMAEKWVQGHEVDWNKVQEGSGQIISLPTYAFDRKRYWSELKLDAWRSGKEKVENVRPGGISNPQQFVPPPTPPPAVHPQLVREVKRPDLSGLKRQIKSIIDKVFLLDEDLEEDRPFFEVGMTSMNVARFVLAVNQQFGVQIEVTDIFDCPTIQKLAERVLLESSTVQKQDVKSQSLTSPPPGPGQQSGRVKNPLLNTDDREFAPENRLRSMLAQVANEEMPIDLALEWLNNET